MIPGYNLMAPIISVLWHRLQELRRDERGMTTETIIITALLAAAALFAVGLIVQAIRNPGPAHLQRHRRPGSQQLTRMMRARRCRSDAGAATTEMVIAAPAFLFMIMLIVQAGLYFHAVSVASAAAQEGARAARHAGATITEGEQVSRDFVTAVAPRLLTNVGVAGGLVDNNQLVRMTVTGDVLEVFRIPGVDIDFSVNETSEGPVERFRPATEAPPPTARRDRAPARAGSGHDRARDHHAGPHRVPLPARRRRAAHRCPLRRRRRGTRCGPHRLAADQRRRGPDPGAPGGRRRRVR